MNPQALFFVVLAVYLATAFVTLLGLAGTVQIPDKYMTPLLTSLII